MMSKEINSNFKTKTHTVPKTFAKKASIYGSAEYEIMKKLYSDTESNSGWTIEIDNTSGGNKANKNLKYEKMKRYIEVATEEDHEELAEFEKIKKLAEIQRSPYTYIKDWFLAKYPEAREAIQANLTVVCN